MFGLSVSGLGASEGRGSAPSPRQGDVRPAPPFLARHAPHHGAPGEQHFLPAAPARPHHLRDLAFLTLALICVATFATRALA